MRDRLTYANVMSTIAVFFVLAGGGAWAASKIGSKDIAKNAVRSKHVKNNALTGKDVKDDALTGNDVNESTLALGLDPPVRLVGAAGQPAFNGGSGGVNCSWKNFSSEYTPAGFFRDSAGVVHLQGRVDAENGSVESCGDLGIDHTIFTLPAGFRPPQDARFPTIAGSPAFQLASVEVEADGDVLFLPTSTFAPGLGSVALDGISFRAG